MFFNELAPLDRWDLWVPTSRWATVRLFTLQTEGLNVCETLLGTKS